MSRGHGFLKELVALKAASDTKYGVDVDVAPPLPTRTTRRSTLSISWPTRPRPLRSFVAASPSCCEYLGDLWFLPRRRRLRFRETVAISHASRDGRWAVVECRTDVLRGRQWVGCARTVCEMSSLSSSSNDDRTAVRVRSDLRLPLFGLDRRVENMISATFRDALTAFVRNEHGAGATQVFDWI